ncbi:hypothetical protein Ple7327_1508 [Pleurocapsa sp. PCC 7327]|uniref:DUF72 domain-containing protein n=1 Tax=Pleurocapsa sp. PCC 7327 TaxID=118163 RepID=UPI00029F812B|nr:DUF72 domain-containing protein [Pleurocapsa sp. PCC 7327]AFY76885.1 hypothetical protein Ple7327_1508 [Pleurocapsa sp. PCC 7327]
MNFYLGCAVWSYKGWIGNFYPPKTQSKNFLRLYSQRLTTVEGNTTFYAVPEATAIERWATETPASFKFCLKLPREITHNGLLMPSLGGAIAFLERISNLGERTGSVFLQLPPSYSPDLLEDLNAFLKSLVKETKALAVEVRHLDWFEDSHANQLNNLLEKLGVGRVLLDTRPIYDCPDDPQLASERRKPKVPLQPCLTANFSLVRFISHPQQEYNQSFLQEWVTQVDRWLRQGTEIYFFVHCPLEERSPFTARYFQQLLERQGVNIPPLPWDCLESSPVQLSLF